jgi:hypothetical protein
LIAERYLQEKDIEEMLALWHTKESIIQQMEKILISEEYERDI